MSPIFGTKHEIVQFLLSNINHIPNSKLKNEFSKYDFHIESQLDAIEKKMNNFSGTSGEFEQWLESHSKIFAIFISDPISFAPSPGVNLNLDSVPVRILTQEESDRRKQETNELFDRLAN